MKLGEEAAYRTCIDLMQKNQVPVNQRVAAQIAGRCGYKSSQSAVAIIEKGMRTYIDEQRDRANANAAGIILPAGMR